MTMVKVAVAALLDGVCQLSGIKFTS